jgi:pyruvate,orthophosphate dikinase
MIDNIASKLKESKNIHLAYKVGTMIETPRACIISEYLADISDFFSFGTNDLT